MFAEITTDIHTVLWSYISYTHLHWILCSSSSYMLVRY